MFFMGEYSPGETIYFPIATYGANNESITLTGLATTDIEIYKNGSTTQRASDAGYALLDTDGIDFDGITGIHGFSVDLSDNTTSGFYEAGSSYWVVVSSVTVNSQTVNLVYHFRIRLDVTQRGTLSGTHDTTFCDLGTLAPANDISGQTLYFPGHKLSRVVDSYNTGTGVATFSPSVAVTLTNGDIWILLPTPPASTGAPPAVNLTQVGGSTTDVSSLATNVAAILVDTGTTLDGKLDTIDNFLDTEVAAILADTNELQTDWANGGRLDLILDARASQTTADAIEADTQNIQSRLPAALNNGVMPADIQRINDVEVVGAGTSGDKWRA